MRLNMEKKDFSEISARLFPKFGMVAIFTGTVALAAYNALHPTPGIFFLLRDAIITFKLIIMNKLQTLSFSWSIWFT